MKKSILFTVAAFWLGGLTAAETARFIGFNIWGDYFKNPVEERVDGILTAVQKYRPDLLALQEVTDGWWHSKLFSVLEHNGYCVVKGDVAESFRLARGERIADKRKRNHVPLAFRTDRYRLLESGFDVFHPRLEHNKGVTWAVLQDRRTGKGLIAFSTHFWWKKNGPESDALRELNAELVMWRLKWLKAKYPYAAIGGGDLNSVPGCWAYEALSAGGYRSAADVADTRSSLSSHHGDPKRDSSGHYRGTLRPVQNTPATSIDHVFVETNGIHAIRHEIVVDQPILDASDHSPVLVDFTVQ